MGVALDVSQSGILIESFQKVESEYLSIMATNKSNSILEIKGKVAYCRKTQSGKFKTGVMLQGSHDDNIRFVKELIRAYHVGKCK